MCANWSKGMGYKLHQTDTERLSAMDMAVGACTDTVEDVRWRSNAEDLCRQPLSYQAGSSCSEVDGLKLVKRLTGLASS